MPKSGTILFIFMAFALFFAACSTTKHLAPGQVLLKTNNLTVKQQVITLNGFGNKKQAKYDTVQNKAGNKQLGIDQTGIPNITRNIDKRKELRNNLLTLIKQKPNTRILLYFPFDLWVYNLAYTKKDKGFYWWVRTHVGEEPVILDTNLCFTSMTLINTYMHNKGYLKSKATYKIKVRHRKASVYFTVNPGVLYTYDTIRYISDNPNLTRTLIDAGSNSLIKRNAAFDVSILDKERDRIAHYFQDKGYFRFNKNQLYYEWDTVAIGHKVNLILHLVQLVDSMIQTPYKINKVFVLQSYTATKDEPTTKTNDTLLYNGIYIISDLNKTILKPFALAENLALKPGQLYSATNSENTLKRLNSIGTFKFVTVHFDFDDSGRINAYYYLTPFQQHLFQADLDLYNTTENPIGSGVKLSYKNRNLSHIALQFLADLNIGVEIANFKYTSIPHKYNYGIGIFNISPKVSLYWPRFVAIPGLNFLQRLFPKNDNPKTDLSLGYAYDQRIKYFTLRSSSAAYGYEEDVSPRTHIIWNLIYISYSKASDYTPDFTQTLKDNPILARSFEFKFIQGSNFVYLHNNQRTQEQKKYYYLRINVDYAGNLLRLFSGLANEGTGILSKNYWDTTHSFSLFANSTYLQFAQFIKFDADIRKYFIIDKRNMFVTRLATGMGVAYGNSGVLPYTKQFFLGGATGMRGWRVYGLGPGTYHPLNPTQILYDQTGDMKLEMNGEYRFSFVGRLKGAFFSDAGNIWNLRHYDSRPEGQFTRDNLLLGWDAGLGLRVDFTFFIFRLDVATPLFDPTQLDGGRWLSTFKPFQQKWLNDHAVFNFAVGYPF